MAKEKSKFQLSKGGDHGFDISKGGKRTFDLTKDIDEPVAPTPEPVPVPAPGPGTTKSNKWIWWVVGLIVLCIIGYFIFSKSDKEQPAQPETEVIEAVTANDGVDEAANQSEGVQDEANAEEAPEAIQTEQPAEEPKSEVPETNVTSTPTKSNTTESASVSNDVEAEAMKVIRGDYGIGQERKAKLGAQYQAIQNRVNELKREGVF